MKAGAVGKKRLRSVQALAEKLKALPHLDESERLLYATSLLATPDERWKRHENFLRSLNLFSYFERRKFGFRSPDARASASVSCPAHRRLNWQAFLA